MSAGKTARKTMSRGPSHRPNAARASPPPPGTRPARRRRAGSTEGPARRNAGSSCTAGWREVGLADHPRCDLEQAAGQAAPGRQDQDVQRAEPAGGPTGRAPISSGRRCDRPRSRRRRGSPSAPACATGLAARRRKMICYGWADRSDKGCRAIDPSPVANRRGVAAPARIPCPDDIGGRCPARSGSPAMMAVRRLSLPVEFMLPRLRSRPVHRCPARGADRAGRAGGSCSRPAATTRWSSTRRSPLTAT